MVLLQLPVIKQQYYWKDSKIIMLFYFNLAADVILVKTNVKKNPLGMQTSAWLQLMLKSWWKVPRISSKILNNSVNKVQNLQESLSSPLLKKLKKNKSFLLLKTNILRASGLSKCLACGWLTNFMLRYHAVISKPKYQLWHFYMSHRDP